MNRYVLVFFGPGNRPARDFAVIKALPDLKIIDATSPNVVLVEGQPSIKEVVNRMRGWMASEETTLPSPGPVRY